MVRNVLVNPEQDDLMAEMLRQTRRPRMLLVLLQILGPGLAVLGVMLAVSVPVGLIVLGCVVTLFGIAIERGLYAR